MAKRMNYEQDYLSKIINWLIEYALIVGTFIFSIIAKVHNILRYKKRMTKTECFIDTVLSGLGSAIIIYILHKMSVQIWLMCILGGYSSLVVTPISTAISKEVTPLLNIIIKGVEDYVKNWFTKKTK